MFKISPINDKELQKSCAERCGAQFREDFFAYAMIDVETGDLIIAFNNLVHDAIPLSSSLYNLNQFV